jgi:AraC-like DNA-binding protein
MSDVALIPFLPRIKLQEQLSSLVENREIYCLKSCELNIFETHQVAENVELQFSDMIVASMLRGKKLIKNDLGEKVEFVPGESALASPNSKTCIDFPEASESNPTQCIALALDYQKVAEITNLLNEKYPQPDIEMFWQLNYDNFFFKNNVEIANILGKIIQTCQSDDLFKDAIADLGIQELIVKIIQFQSLDSMINNGNKKINPQLMLAIEFIKSNLPNKLNLQLVAKKIGMSSSSMYRLFKTELGISPMEFIIMERIKLAKLYLSDKHNFVKNVSYEVGFDDTNYFIRIFKHYEGVTPKKYQQSIINS